MDDIPSDHIPMKKINIEEQVFLQEQSDYYFRYADYRQLHPLDKDFNKNVKVVRNFYRMNRNIKL